MGKTRIRFGTVQNITINDDDIYIDGKRINTGEGKIFVELHIQGQVLGDVYAESGNVTVDYGINGDINTTSGDVSVTGAGRCGHITTTSGDVEVVGEVTTVSTTSGDVNIVGVVGDHPKTKSGEVKIRNVKQKSSISRLTSEIIEELTPSEPPLERLYSNDSTKFCKVCGSTIKTAFLGFSELGCIQPKCSNFYLK